MISSPLESETINVSAEKSVRQKQIQYIAAGKINLLERAKNLYRGN